MIRKLLPAALLTASLSGCGFSGIHTSEPMRYWIFQMPEVHDQGTEYLVCLDDSLSRGASCSFNGIQGTYEEAQDASFLNIGPDSSVSWPNHDGIGPIFVRKSH